MPVGGGWVEGGVKTLLTGGSTKKFTAGARGVGVWEKVWRFCHRQVAPQHKCKVGKHKKIKTSKQSKHKYVLPPRHKVKFVSHHLPTKKWDKFDSVTHSQKQKRVKPESPMNPLRRKVRVQAIRYKLTCQTVKFQSARPTLPRQKVKFQSARPLYPEQVNIPKCKAPYPAKT